MPQGPFEHRKPLLTSSISERITLHSNVRSSTKRPNAQKQEYRDGTFRSRSEQLPRDSRAMDIRPSLL
jgi:hypothetical protein